MCGASAESIMLALAIAINGSEDDVLREYKSANGRSKIENMIVGKRTDRIKQEFLNFSPYAEREFFSSSPKPTNIIAQRESLGRLNEHSRSLKASNNLRGIVRRLQRLNVF